MSLAYHREGKTKGMPQFQGSPSSRQFASATCRRAGRTRNAPPFSLDSFCTIEKYTCNEAPLDVNAANKVSYRTKAIMKRTCQTIRG
eukprot:6181146-Pleurochrysis_carterae.AAC.2